jgi:hypothetical protein
MNKIKKIAHFAIVMFLLLLFFACKRNNTIDVEILRDRTLHLLIQQYDREEDVLKYVKCHLKRSETSSVLFYREPCNCGYSVNPEIIDDYISICETKEIENRFIICDSKKSYNEILFMSKSHNCSVILDYSSNLDKYGIVKIPYVFVISSDKLVFWKRYL